jgi:hypothetical protein
MAKGPTTLHTASKRFKFFYALGVIDLREPVPGAIHRPFAEPRG